MKRERGLLVALAAAGAMVFGWSGVGSAQDVEQPGEEEGYSYTQPAAELIAPYDTSAGRVTFLVASNVSGRAVSTHWIFWNDSCSEEVDFSICLTPNDTIVVDPTNMSAVGADNQPVGPQISLTGRRGLVTIVAYETDDACSPYGPDTSIADNTIVGSFTFADTDDGYSFGNDALGLGTNQCSESDPTECVQVPGNPGDRFEFTVQTFNPTTVENSVVVLSHIAELAALGDNRPNGYVVPGTPAVVLNTSFIDTTEIPTSLPDVRVSCTRFLTVDEDDPLIPATTTVETSGIVRLQPRGQFPVGGSTYLYGIVGQAVGSLGSSASVKVETLEGSPSPAFIDGIDQNLF